MPSWVITILQKNSNGEEETKYKCIYCDKLFSDELKAQSCVKNHDLIYLPISKNDLNRLNQFFFLGDNKLLTESLIRIVQKYAKQAVRSS